MSFASTSSTTFQNNFTQSFILQQCLRSHPYFADAVEDNFEQAYSHIFCAFADEYETKFPVPIQVQVINPLTTPLCPFLFPQFSCPLFQTFKNFASSEVLSEKNIVCVLFNYIAAGWETVVRVVTILLKMRAEASVFAQVLGQIEVNLTLLPFQNWSQNWYESVFSAPRSRRVPSLLPLDNDSLLAGRRSSRLDSWSVLPFLFARLMELN